MKQIVTQYWQNLEARERAILGWGGALVVLILFYALIWQPWQHAISFMEQSVQGQRSNLVWMKQQAESIKNGASVTAGNRIKGQNQSLLSVIEQTAKASKVREAIQQMVPGQNAQEVRVVLEGANFNQWVLWIDVLFKQYAVTIKQLSAEREDDEPNIAEIRVTFERTQNK